MDAPTREEACQLLRKYNKDQSQFAMPWQEAVMRHFAEVLDEPKVENEYRPGT